MRILLVISADLTTWMYNVKSDWYMCGCVVDAHRGIVDINETPTQPYHITQEDRWEMALKNASSGKC